MEELFQHIITIFIKMTLISTLLPLITSFLFIFFHCHFIISLFLSVFFLFLSQKQLKNVLLCKAMECGIYPPSFVMLSLILPRHFYNEIEFGAQESAVHRCFKVSF